MYKCVHYSKRFGPQANSVLGHKNRDEQKSKRREEHEKNVYVLKYTNLLMITNKKKHFLLNPVDKKKNQQKTEWVCAVVDVWKIKIMFPFFPECWRETLCSSKPGSN